MKKSELRNIIKEETTKIILETTPSVIGHLKVSAPGSSIVIQKEGKTITLTYMEATGLAKFINNW